MIESAETLNSQAIELASHGEYTEAIACFRKALLIESANYLLWYNLGVTYRDSGNLEAAKTALLKSYDLEPEDEDVLETLSLICISLNELQEAYIYALKALELNSDNAHTWNNLGVLFFVQGNTEKACDAFEQAVTIYPHYYDALYNLRDAYQELGNLVGVEECKNRLRNLQPNKSNYV